MNDELLDDFKSNEEIVFKVASKGKRFANYIIDRIVIVASVTATFFGLAYYMPYLGIFEIFDKGGIETRLLDYLITGVFIIFYYSIIETAFGGKSLGKLITKTRAVNNDNSKMNFGTALKRSFCRVIPFEQFSYLGSGDTGWHDNISDTKVIEDIGWKN